MNRQRGVLALIVTAISLTLACVGGLPSDGDARRDALTPRGDSAGGTDPVGGDGDTGDSPAAWRAFSSESPWNTPIPASAAIRPDSDALIDHLASSAPEPLLSVSIHPWSIPIYFVSESVPGVDVRSRLSNEGEGLTFRWPVPVAAIPAAEADGHLTLVDRARGRGYDFYQARAAPDGSWDCALCATIDLSRSGVRPPKGGPTEWYESHGSRACGFPLIAGLITVDELRAGRIDHALTIAYPGIRQRGFVSPASTGHPANGIISEDRGVPCGGRIQLDPAVDIDALGLPPAGRVVARALAEYGAYVGDFSGSINFYADGSPEARAAWSGGLLESADANGIPIRSLRVIEWGTLSPSE